MQVVTLAYDKGTKEKDPIIYIGVGPNPSTWHYFQMFIRSLFGFKSTTLHPLTDAEVESISSLIVRRRIVMKIRHHVKENVSED